MNLDEYVDRLARSEHRYMHAVMRAEKADAQAASLTVPQYWALRFLGGHGPCPVKAVCDAMHVKFSSGSGLVDGLVELGLVSRERSKEDRRVVMLALTAKGQRIVTRAHENKKRMIRELFEPLSEREREQYLKLAEKIAEGLPEL